MRAVRQGNRDTPEQVPSTAGNSLDIPGTGPAVEADGGGVVPLRLPPGYKANPTPGSS